MGVMGSTRSRRECGSGRVRSLVLGGFVLLGVSSACGGRTDVEVQEVSVHDEGATLVFQVNTCNEDSTSVSIVESDSEIVVTASTRARFGCSGGDDCSDPRSVQLGEPLGDRQIVDEDGNEIRRVDS